VAEKLDWKGLMHGYANYEVQKLGNFWTVEKVLLSQQAYNIITIHVSMEVSNYVPNLTYLSLGLSK
jgi:hypothetical protein